MSSIIAVPFIKGQTKKPNKSCQMNVVGHGKSRCQPIRAVGRAAMRRLILLMTRWVTRAI